MQSSILSLVTKINNIIDNLIVAPGNFEVVSFYTEGNIKIVISILAYLVGKKIVCACCEQFTANRGGEASGLIQKGHHDDWSQCS